MGFVSDVRERLRALVFRRREERGLDAELRFHVEMQTEANMRRGMDPKDARRRAHLKLGGVEQTKEGVREARGTRWLEDVGQDLRYTARTLRRSPGFAAVAVLTVALGTGATTALFSAVNGLLLRPLPLHEPARVAELSGERSFGAGSFSHPQYETLRAATRTLAGVAARNERDVVLDAGGPAEEVEAAFVSGGYFGLLGVRPESGRLIRPADDRRGAATAGVVLSHRFWRLRFSADPSVIGRTVRLNDRSVVVLGVLEESFDGMSFTPPPAVFAPLALQPRIVPGAETFDAMTFGLELIGRLRDGVSWAAARAELAGLAPRINERVPVPEMVALGGIEARGLTRVPESDREPLLRSLTLLGIATLLVLLIASTNIGGMMLARGAGRRREMAVRAALGAGRGRLARQLVAEALALFVLGGAAGLLLAVWLTDLLGTFRWPDPLHLDLAPDHRVLGFALAVSLASGLAFSLLPARRAARPRLVPSLKHGEQGGGRRSARLRRALVVGQIAMSVVLLVGAGLFVRTLRTAFTFESGFEPDRVWAASIDVGRLRYGETEAAALYDRILERARAIAGVESATLTTRVPLGPGGSDQVRVRHGRAPANDEIEVRALAVDPAFFRTLGIPVLRGRVFDADRGLGSPRVAVINETLARRLWPGENPVGRRLHRSFSARLMMSDRSDEMKATYEVVGVIADGRYASLREPPRPFVFVPLAGNHRSRVALAVRVRPGEDEAAVAATVRDAVHAVDPALPLLAVSPIQRRIEDAFLAQRIGAALTSLFAALGLVLSVVGLYGVMAYTVRQRTREIGVRMALGAGAGRLLRETLGRGVALAAAGLALGVALAFVASRLLTGFLFGVSPADPVSFGFAVALLLAVATLAAYVPARRAARTDPMRALRDE